MCYNMHEKRGEVIGHRIDKDEKHLIYSGGRGVRGSTIFSVVIGLLHDFCSSFCSLFRFRLNYKIYFLKTLNF